MLALTRSWFGASGAVRHPSPVRHPHGRRISMRVSCYRSKLLAGWAVAVVAAAGMLSAAGALSAASSSAASAGCSVTYTVSSQWPSGFNANVVITNLGSQITSWTLTWDFAAGQQITQGWSAAYSQSGTQVTAVNKSWDSALATGGLPTIYLTGTWKNKN